MFDYKDNKHINNLESRWSNILCNETIKIIKDKNVLDLGSFDGYGSNKMKSLGAKDVFSIEINKELSELSIDKYPEIKVLNMDVEHVDFKSLEFRADVVTCFGLIYFLNDYDIFLKNINAINSLNYIIIENIDTHINKKFKIIRFINKQKLIKSIEDSGFKIILIKNFKVDEFANSDMANRVLIIAKKIRG